MNKTKKKKQPIIISVTGHRNIDLKDKVLNKKIVDICRELKYMHPNSDFIIMSGLAEGADRLVAQIAMKELDAKLITVLAVPEESFTMDFGSKVSVNAFKKLVASSSEVITAPLLSKNAWKQYTPSRNYQYAWMGAFIAKHSDILIAIWDGEKAKGVGGTAHVVRWFKQNKIPKSYQIESDNLAKLAGVFTKKIRKAENRKFIHIEP